MRHILCVLPVLPAIWLFHLRSFYFSFVVFLDFVIAVIVN